MASYGDLQNISSPASRSTWSFIFSSQAEYRDKMPSIRSLTTLLLSTVNIAQTALGLSSPVFRLSGNDTSSSESCPQPQLSCHNSTVVDNLCCFNAPGGSLLQTQFWDTDPVSGPENSWTIHGLWPDHCDGTYDANCDDTRSYSNISDILTAAGDTDLLQYMQKYWTSNTGSAFSFWEHEWDKHGTCISTLRPDCYTDYKPTEEVPDFFSKTVSLFKTLPTYDWLNEAGITPSSSETYTLAQIQDTLQKKHGGGVYVGCNNGELDEIWYYFNVRGSVQTGTFKPSENDGSASTCDSTGIKYLPKGGGGGGSPTSTAPSSSGTAPSSTSSSPPSPTGPPFSGKGYLNVITSGSKKGCIISGGTWYTTGTCATFTVTPSSNGFTLNSSKGGCAIAAGELACSSSIGDPSTFTANGSSLAYDGKGTWFADSVPSGSEQASLFASGEGHDVSLSIEWQSV